jgi:hypothetical protein
MSLMIYADHQVLFLNLMSKTVDKSRVLDLQVKKS